MNQTEENTRTIKRTEVKVIDMEDNIDLGLLGKLSWTETIDINVKNVLYSCVKG